MGSRSSDSKKDMNLFVSASISSDGMASRKPMITKKAGSTVSVDRIEDEPPQKYKSNYSNGDETSTKYNGMSDSDDDVIGSTDITKPTPIGSVDAGNEQTPWPWIDTRNLNYLMLMIQ